MGDGVVHEECLLAFQENQKLGRNHQLSDKPGTAQKQESESSGDSARPELELDGDKEQLVVAAEGVSLNWLSPVASGGEKPPRPRSITIISYVMFISAAVVALGMFALNVDSNAQRAADAASWMPLQAFYLVGFVSLMVNLSCGALIRTGSNAARLTWMGWTLFGVIIYLPDGPALSWVSIVLVGFFLSTPKALAFFADRPDS